MRMRSVLLLAIAAGCGLAAMLVFQHVANRSAGAVEEERVRVLVALADITPGSKLTEKNVEFREFPITVVPPNVITSKEEFFERCIKVRAFPGDVITLDKLGSKGHLGLSNEIPSGMVAITIGVDNTMTSSGLLGPGDRVDVMVTYRSLNNRGLGKEIKTVLEYIEVFAADEKRDQSVGAELKAKTITLIMTTDQAKLLKLAEDVGKLHLAMRSREDSSPRVKEEDRFHPEEAEKAQAIVKLQDKETPEAEKSALQAFLDAQNMARAQVASNGGQPSYEPVPAMPKWSIEIYSGDQKRVEEVDDPTGEVPQAGQGPGAGSRNPLVNGLKALFGAPAAEPQPQASPQLTLPPQQPAQNQPPAPPPQRRPSMTRRTK